MHLSFIPYTIRYVYTVARPHAVHYCTHFSSAECVVWCALSTQHSAHRVHSRVLSTQVHRNLIGTHCHSALNSLT